MTSLEVFLKFVKYETDTQTGLIVPNVSGLLSSECFDAWIKSRKGVLKHPEESFRRSLTAHVTGIEGRRPFPEDIEEALIKELKKQKKWPCFEGKLCDGKELNIGLQGIRTLGFHESQRSKTQVVQQTKANMQPRGLLQSEVGIRSPGDSHQTLEQLSLSCLMKWMKNRRVYSLILNTFQVSINEYSINKGASGGFSGLGGGGDILLLSPSVCPKTVRADFVHNMLRSLTPARFCSILQSCKEFAPHLVDQYAIMKLQGPITIHHLRFEGQVLIRDENLRFNPAWLIGHETICASTLVYTKCDSNAELILGASEESRHLGASMQASFFWLFVKSIFPALLTSGVALFESKRVTPLGNEIVLLCEYTWVPEEDCIHVKLQRTTSCLHSD